MQKVFFCISFSLLLSALVYAGEKVAEAVTYVDGSGAVYMLTINENGGVLKSGKDTLYLGRGCDAYAPQYGKGSWGWANGGFVITFDAHSVGFPRQEIEVGNHHGCRL
ncbi:hypothetical protein QE250_08210 [Chromatiaceae bacterium AAb-1]|nr:hypothetical protein [Chromatiaceae bacterium AAb-1]